MSIMTAEEASRVVLFVDRGDMGHHVDMRPQSKQDREVWITVGSERTGTGERASYCFRNIGQAHAAGFWWVR